MNTPEHLFTLVCSEVHRVSAPGVTLEDIAPSALLIEDLGVDSLRFVDLAVALESALGIADFPMQAWVDECLDHDRPLNVQALLSQCAALVSSAPPSLS
jgi:acyl carrier protein